LAFGEGDGDGGGIGGGDLDEVDAEPEACAVVGGGDDEDAAWDEFERGEEWCVRFFAVWWGGGPRPVGGHWVRSGGVVGGDSGGGVAFAAVLDGVRA